MGVTNRALVRRLRAWTIGAPVARGTTIHTAVGDDENRFILAFVRMGGESRPWAVAWQRGENSPEIRYVGEPRSREFVDAMLLDLAEDLAAHLGHPYYESVSAPERGMEVDPSDLRQVWVPNSSHIDMLHFLSYAYVRRKGDTEADISLRMLGRTALHLFLESRRPGQQIIIDASAALRSAFDFPCEDSRQGHLGLLLAWLDNRADRDRGIAAALVAEQLTVGISLDPALERDVLVTLVEDYNSSRKNRGKGSAAIVRKIGAVLESELARRVELVQQGIAVIESDEREYNAGLAGLARTTYDQLYYSYLRGEADSLESGREPFAPSPETDWDPRNAADRYFRYSAALDRERNALIHYDRELEAEAINEGSAFRGVITSVADEREGRKSIPVWAIVDTTPGALSLRQWDSICVVGAPNRTGVIREVTPLDDGSLELTVEITNLKKQIDGADWPHRMAATDQSWLGIAVTLISTSFADMTDQKASKVRARDTAPADWMLSVVSRRTETAEDSE